mgnify:CR=1 FL=1
MELSGITAWQWLALVQHELLLFAALFFLLGAADELCVDLAWLWLRLTGRARAVRFDPAEAAAGELEARSAVFIPAWDEAQVIGPMLRHLLGAWRQRDLRVYLGCYANDLATLEAASAAAGDDPRVRIVVVGASGPTTKADCLNRLYRALEDDEHRQGQRARLVILHDAEDMVDPAALALLDRAIGGADLVQLPVVPLPHPRSRWIGGHYVDEFAEQHGKALVVRDALGAGVPMAGVGCAIARDMLDRLPGARGGAGPFAAECLTEDYELGLVVADMGGRTRFLRARAPDGRLIATRAYFPGTLVAAVRQKTRWIHGIAFQGWDRLGWRGHPADLWMRLRDRRSPFTALTLAIAYLLLALFGLAWIAGPEPAAALSPFMRAILWLNLASLVWRSLWRFGFTAREHGPAEGLRAVLRIPVANVIAIMAGRRALAAYVRVLCGQQAVWDKTEHRFHPAGLAAHGAGA